MFLLFARRLHHEEFSLVEGAQLALRTYLHRCRALHLEQLIDEGGRAILDEFCTYAARLFRRLEAIRDRDGMPAAIAELVRVRNTLGERHPRPLPPHRQAHLVIAVQVLPGMRPVVVVSDDRERIRESKAFDATTGPPR